MQSMTLRSSAGARLDPDAVQRCLRQAQERAADRQNGHRTERSKARGKAVSSDARTTPIFKSARADTFEMKAITWLWPDRFAVGKLGLIAGLPDEGKGQILADMASRVTRGALWPCGEGRALLGNVIVLSAEDDPSDTIVPRLVSAGADLSRIHIVSMVQDKGKDRMFSLVTDLALLRQKIIEVGDVRMIQIDPISAYLGVGKVDSFRTTDVRAVLAPLVDLAAEMQVSIIGIMHFNKKLDVTNALLRISDSLAFGATARHVFAAVDDPENKRKLFLRGKNNLARRDIQALAYNFEEKQVAPDIWAPHIVWHQEHVDVSASEEMQAATGNKAPVARDDPKKFLEEFLAEGPQPQTDIVDAAKADLISEKTLRRAGRALQRPRGCRGGTCSSLRERLLGATNNERQHVVAVLRISQAAARPMVSKVRLSSSRSRT
jgi:putative DNA primase/helicase